MNCCSEDTSSSGCCCGCGQTKRETRICMCLPYKDGFMITAQIISIIAFGLLCGFISGWLTLIVGLISSVFLQLVWCCRQSKIGLFVSVGISTLAGITCTIAGIVTFSAWKDQFSVFTVFDADGSDDFYDDYDQFYGVAAFITATLWFTTSGLILYFVGSGRYAIWEEKEKLRGASDTTPTTTTATPTAIEMGAVQHQHDDHQQEQQQTTTGTYSVATAAAATTATAIDHDHDHTTCSTADSYVLPEISNKVDNV